VGHVLGVYRSPESTSNIRYSDTDMLDTMRTSPLWGRQGPTGHDASIRGPQPETDLPPERHALLFVFRTFDKVSYALVMHATAAINMLDYVRNP